MNPPVAAPSLGVSSAVTAPSTGRQDLLQLWVDVLQRIASQVQRPQFITWFRETAIVSRDGATILVGLPLPTFLNWHMEHYRDMTLTAAREIDPTIENVMYSVDTGLKDTPGRGIDLLQHFPEHKKRKLPGRQEVKLAEGIVSKVLNPQYSLENFIVGSNNRLAHAACQAVAMQPGGKYNPLFLYGGVGLGKTHLLQGTGNAILRNNPRATVVYTTSEDFTNQVVEAIQHQRMEQFNKRYRSVDVLIIDDIQFIANKDRTQEVFFHTFNSLYEERKQIIISADRPPQELQVHDRLMSRFARGMIADVSIPDYETRLAILSEKAAGFEVFLDPAVLQFMAEHVTRNIRELEGILMQAIALYELEQRMPTIRTIAEIMQKLGHNPHQEEEQQVGFEQKPRRQPSFQEVLEAVSRYYSVSMQDMVGPSRVRQVLLPRQIAMHLGKKHLRMSYVRLGEAFGGRDHTTVMNAIEKIEGVLHTDPQLLREIRAIEQEVGVV